MVRSRYRLPLLYPIVLFSFVACGQMSAAPRIGNSETAQQQQQTGPQQSSDSAAPAQQSAPRPTDSLPDDPATTAHIEAPIAPDGPTVVLDTSMGRMTCGLYSKEAPVAVANFIGLATGTQGIHGSRHPQKGAWQAVLQRHHVSSSDSGIHDSGWRSHGHGNGRSRLFFQR